MHRFLKHLDGWEIPFEELTPEDLQAFFTEAALQPASRNLYLVMLGHLYESLGRTDDNPGRARIEAMLIRFLLGTGLRISEAAALTRARLGLDARAPRIQVIGKNDVERTVPIRPALAGQLRDYLARLEEEFHQAGPLLFPNGQGRPLAPSSHYRAIQKHLRTLGICKPQRGPHVLRHTFVTRQFRAGVPPAVIKAWCGHADLGVTLKVYEGVASAPEGVVPV